MPECSDALLLLAKYPEPGAVKTRLVNGTEENHYLGLKDIPDAQGTCPGQAIAYSIAADLYKAFLIDRFRAHQGRAYDLFLGTTQPEYGKAFRSITGPNVLYHAVHGTNLGEMMLGIFQDLLPRYRKVIIAGSDFPYLQESVIDRTFQRLDTSDIILVPAYDGAYNLIGMSRLHNIFTISRWSSGSELQETRRLLESEHITHTVFDDTRLLDIDTIEDLRALTRTLRKDQAPVTFARLQDLRTRLQLTV